MDQTYELDATTETMLIHFELGYVMNLPNCIVVPLLGFVGVVGRRRFQLAVNAPIKSRSNKY